MPGFQLACVNRPSPRERAPEGYAGPRRLGERIEAGLLNIGPMAREDLRAAIVEPANRTGLEFEHGLIERILDDLTRQPGALPLLAFALAELWHHREGTSIAHAAYTRIGGVAGAIARRAEAQFNSLSRTERAVALSAMSRLVHVSRTGEVGDTLQSVLLSEFTQTERTVISAFAEARLLVLDSASPSIQQRVQLSHEALIHHWDRLRCQIDSDREFLLWRQKIDALLPERESSLHDHRFRLRGPLLQEGRKWLKARPLAFSNQQKDLITSSVLTEKASRLLKGGLIAVAIGLIFLVAGWLIWTETDRYQIETATSSAQLLVQPIGPAVRDWLPILAVMRGISDVMRITEQLGDLGFQARVLTDIGSTLTRAGRNDEAEVAFAAAKRAALRATDAQTRSAAMNGLSSTFTKLGRLDESLQLSKEIDLPVSRVGPLADVFVSLASSGRSREANEVFAIALKTARVDVSSEWRADSLATVASALTIVGGIDEALALIQEIDRSEVRAHCIAPIITRVILAGGKSGSGDIIAQGLKAARETKNPLQQAKALADIAVSVAKSGGTDRALEIVHVIDDPASRIEPLTEVCLAKKRLHQRADVTVAEALAIASTLLPELRAGAFERIAAVVSEVGTSRQAIEIVGRITEPSLRAAKEAALASVFIQANEPKSARTCLSTALIAVEQMPTGSDRSEVLSQVAILFAKLHDYPKARQLADRCSEPGFRLAAYSAVVREDILQRNPNLLKALGEGR